MCMARTQCDIHVLNTPMFSLFDGVEFTQEMDLKNCHFFTSHVEWPIYVTPEVA